MGRSVVSMETSGLLVLSVIVWLIFHHGQLLLVGRTSGYLGFDRHTSLFCCSLHNRQSLPSTYVGAYTSLMGRIGTWWDGRLVSTFSHFLSALPSRLNNYTGAIVVL